MPNKIKVTSFEEFESTINNMYGAKNVRFTHVGENGWSELVVDKNGPKLVRIPDVTHWVDACPIGKDNSLRILGKSLGRYEFHLQRGTVFDWSK